MLEVRRTGRYLLAVTAGLIALACVGGTIESVRVMRRMPAINLLANGSLDYIDVLISRRNYDGAIEQLRLQTRLVPHDAEAHEYLGTVLGLQGRPEEARIQFQEVVRLRPDYAEGYYFLGATYFDTKEFDSAEACFLQAIELKPEFPMALNNLGKASTHLGKLDVAEKYFAKAVELSPDFDEAKVNLDWARQQLQQSQPRP